MTARRGLGLRARATAAFAVTSLVLSAALAIVAYEVTRHYLLEQREDAAQRQSYVNARVARSLLRADESDVTLVLSSLQTSSDGAAVLRVGGAWYGTSLGVGRDEIPSSLRRVLEERDAGRQRVRLDDEPYVAVGVPIAAVGALYVEFVPLGELQRALDALGRTLTAGVIVATVGAAILGRYASGRVLRPVGRMAVAAAAIGEGKLESRLDAEGDSDLAPLVAAFNDMAEGLQARIEREARFASDVSHELRAPLAAMSSALNVARRQRGEDEALDVLEAKIDDFSHLVLDLLEISRVEAGVAELQLDTIEPAELVDGVLGSTGRTGVDVRVAPGAPRRVALDKRRVGQMVTNLLDNADRYGGGARVVAVEGDDHHLVLAVEDDGPGVPPHEREYVFERFARGELSSRPDAPSGTGLGLALVAEHARLHGGTVHVEDAPGGGARFVIDLPVRT